jgi:hypothetical protein
MNIDNRGLHLLGFTEHIALHFYIITMLKYLGLMNYMLLFRLKWLILRLTLEKSGLNFLSRSRRHSSLSLIYVLINLVWNEWYVWHRIRLVVDKRILHVILLFACIFFLKGTPFWYLWLSWKWLLDVRWNTRILRIKAWSWTLASIVVWEV